MRKRKIDNDRFIINVENKYYVVNEYTFDIIDLYNTKKDIKSTAKTLKMSVFRLKHILKKLQKEIASVEYYDNNIDLKFPLKAQWKVTNKCNLRCKHCYLGELNNYELKKEELMNIAQKIVESNVMEVTITGGEALLVSSLPEIVKLLIKNDIKVNIFTNAILLETFEKKIVKLLGYAPTNKLDFFISIDGLESSHDNIRGKGNFKKTINNVKIAVNKGYRITTNTVLSTLNYKDVPKLYEMLCNIGVYKIQISNLIDSGSASSDMKINKKQHENFIIELKEVLKKLDDGSKLLYAEMPDEECSSEVYILDKDKTKHLQTEQWKCSAGIGKCTIDYNGDVYCCPFIRNYCLGNLVKEDMDTIWSNKKRFEFLKLIAKENNNSRVCIAAKQRMENNK